MNTKTRRLAIIPARGGSKRIPGKNVREFCGRPIIAYSIAAAQETGLFDSVIVSTDCPQIEQVALDCGALVPFRRPPELADDHTPILPVIRHALDWADNQGHAASTACCITATAPLIRPEDVHRGFELLLDDPANQFACAVTSFNFPIWRAIKIESGRVSMIWPEHELRRSQDLPEAFHDAGQFYWGHTSAFRSHDRIFSARTIPVPIPRYLVQDIDSLEDWRRAELLFQANRQARDQPGVQSDRRSTLSNSSRFNLQENS